MIDDTPSQETDYGVIKNNPELQLKLVEKYVKVDLIKNCSYTGFVHSIDPITNSVILSVPHENTYHTIIIPGHAITDITREEPINVEIPRRKQVKHETELVLKRKNKIFSWFKSNLLPVKELEDRLVIGDVSLLSPYSTLDICTENPIVALQIRKIMERMPKDFEE